MHLFHLRDRRAAAPSATGLPLNAPTVRRDRRRRGGPRTPLPLLPVIAVCAGIGLAYVSQTAQATQANYDQTSLIHQQQQLTLEDQQLGSQLGELSASARIIESAQQLGMVTGGTWAYAVAPAAQVATPPATELAAPSTQSGGSVLGEFGSALLGVFGGSA
jgi:TPP-dependent trihydroxycyclohexane-1,2-dione (THcHDO) dehydratase